MAFSKKATSASICSWRRLRIKSRMYSLMESNARASKSARANSANSGFNEMFMVTAFTSPKLIVLAGYVKACQSSTGSRLLPRALAGGFRGMDFGFCFGQIMLESRAGHQLTKRRLAQHPSRLHIGREMLADQHAIPANFPADFQNGVLLLRKHLRDHQGIDRAPGGMSARIAETGLGFAQSQLWIQDIGTWPFPMVFGDVDDVANLRLHLVEQFLDLRKFAGLEVRPDGARKQEQRKSRVLVRPRFLGGCSMFEYHARRRQIRSLLGGAGNRGRRQQRHPIRMAGSQVMFLGAKRCRALESEEQDEE